MEKNKIDIEKYILHLSLHNIRKDRLNNLYNIKNLYFNNLHNAYETILLLHKHSLYNKDINNILYKAFYKKFKDKIDSIQEDNLIYIFISKKYIFKLETNYIIKMLIERNIDTEKRFKIYYKLFYESKNKKYFDKLYYYNSNFYNEILNLPTISKHLYYCEPKIFDEYFSLFTEFFRTKKINDRIEKDDYKYKTYNNYIFNKVLKKYYFSIFSEPKNFFRDNLILHFNKLNFIDLNINDKKIQLQNINSLNTINSYNEKEYLNILKNINKNQFISFDNEDIIKSYLYFLYSISIEKLYKN